MDKFPLEILYNITSYLTYSEKLNLSCVCRDWYKLVQSTCLFTCFTVKGANTFNAAFSTLKEKLQLCHQVRSLQLTRIGQHYQNILQLPTLLPRLNQFAYQNYSLHDYDDLEYSEQNLRGWKRIESYEEANKKPLLVLLLTNLELPGLRKIKIDFCMKYNSCYNLFRLMKHTPNLECFELSFAIVNLEMMEILHSNLPSLKELVFSDIRDEPSDFDLVFESGEMPLRMYRGDRLHPVPIQPASKITSIRFIGLVSVDGDPILPFDWVVYTALKYINAKHLTIRKRITDEVFSNYLRGLKLIVSNLIDLEAFDSNILILHDNTIEDLDRNGIFLKKICLSCQVYSQLSSLSMSHQRSSLRHMAIKASMFLPEYSGFLACFENLRSLKIDINSRAKASSPVQFDTLLKKLHCLEDLALSGCNVQLRSRNRKELSHTFKLKTLTFKSVMLMNVSFKNKPAYVLEFASQTCPHLTMVTIQGKIMSPDQQPITAYFPEQPLQSINLNIIGNTLYKVNNGVSTQWYSYHRLKLKEIQEEPTQGLYISIVHRRTCRVTLHGKRLPNYF